METTSYQLRIDTEHKFYDKVTSIIGLHPRHFDFGWSYEVVLEELEIYYDVIQGFLDSIEGKFDELMKLGIERDNITVWLIYGYNNQCNMEFDPAILERLGKMGIRLCITCYEAGSE